jgi:Arrestin (or S-antigen), C-terminal domain
MCQTKGTVSVRIKFEKGEYLPGDKATFIYSIANNSSEIIQSISFTLTHKVEIKTTMYSRSSSSLVQYALLDGVNAGVTVKDKQGSLTLPPCKDLDFQGLDEAVLAQQEEHNEQALVDSISPSVDGNLIKSYYRFDVVINMNVCCQSDKDYYLCT